MRAMRKFEGKWIRIYNYNSKETLDISGAYNEKRKLREFDTDRTLTVRLKETLRNLPNKLVRIDTRTGTGKVRAKMEKK